ncbi:MAG: hypothetical protein U9O66_00805 [Patescibacteria group bacterium]|nr:hypothetical protein [Patescibacteria group bacterium]
MLKNIFYKIISHFPSKSGKIAFDDLKHLLAHGGINIDIRFIQDESGNYYIAKSTNLDNKRIIATGKTLAELDINIKDAIFSIFQVPSYYYDKNLINIPNLSEKINLQYASI